MPEIMDDIAYLSQEVGPRPAGTEEEQQAALYIADQMQKRSGFAASIEDFTCAVQPGIVEAILFGTSALFSLLAVLSGIFVIPAFLVCLVCAVLFIFELIDRPVLSRFFDRGISQNVVARYVPGKNADARGRKVVLVANYDSAKVSRELNGGLFGIYPLLTKAAAVALLVLPLIWLIRSLFLLHSSGGAVVFFNLLAVIALVLTLVPLARFLFARFATYNEAANNNAAGVAAMLEVARLISEGSMSEEEIEALEDARVHDAEAAYAAGVVPEGAELVYDVEDTRSEEERLAAAKAAVEALTGQPLHTYENEDVVSLIDVTPADEAGEEDYVDMDYGEYGYQDDEAEGEAPAAAAESYERTPVTERVVDAEEAEPAEGEPADADGHAVQPAEEEAPSYVPSSANEPSWFVAGRAKAAKPANDNVPIRRSRYADALDAALEASRKHVEEAARLLDEGTREALGQAHRRAEGVADTDLSAQAASLQELFAAPEPPAHDDIESDQADPATEAAPTDAPDADLSQGTSDADQHQVVEAAGAPDADQPGSASDAAEAPEAPAEAQAEADAPDATDDSTLDADQSSEVEADVAQPVSAEDAPEPGPHAPDPSAEPSTAPQSASERPAAAPARSVSVPEITATEQPEPIESVMLSYEEVELLDGATTAMPPIDVAALRAEAAEAKAGRQRTEGESYDFTQIGTAPERHRRHAVAPTPASDQPVSEAPEQLSLDDAAPTSASDAVDPLASGRLPRIDEPFDEEPIETEEERVAREEEARRAVAEKRAALRSAIPSLSGDFVPSEGPSDEENTEVSKTGSFAAVGSATAIEPVGDELVADLAPEDRYVEDADDSSFGDNVTETGAFAGPDYMDMPESRISRFFNRFRRKRADEEQSASEWLDVDEDFNPTEVGAARGSWESFRSDDDAPAQRTGAHAAVPKDPGVTGPTVVLPPIGDDDFLDEDPDEGADDTAFEDTRSWHGGAFSLRRARGAGDDDLDDDDLYDFDDEEADEDETYDDASADEGAYNAEAEELEWDRTEPDAVYEDADEPQAEEEPPAQQPVRAAATADGVPNDPGDAGTADDVQAADDDAQAAAAPVRTFDAEAEAARIAEEAALIYSFRNPDINTEVWFVALGSEHAGNGGMKAFLDEHADELRGAIIVNLEAFGAGELSLLDEEGYVLTRRPSSRMARFLAKASEVTGITTSRARIDWRESAATVAMRRGLQAMTLAGMEGGKPALAGQGDDVLENVDEGLVAQRARFVLELIKNI